MATSPVEFLKRRPAETAMPIATVIAALIGKALGVEDTDTLFYIALAISFVPAAVTWVVDIVRGSKSNIVDEVPIEPTPIEPLSTPTTKTSTKQTSTKRKPDEV